MKYIIDVEPQGQVYDFGFKDFEILFQKELIVTFWQSFKYVLSVSSRHKNWRNIDKMSMSIVFHDYMWSIGSLVIINYDELSSEFLGVENLLSEFTGASFNEEENLSSLFFESGLVLNATKLSVVLNLRQENLSYRGLAVWYVAEIGDGMIEWTGHDSTRAFREVDIEVGIGYGQ